MEAFSNASDHAAAFCGIETVEKGWLGGFDSAGNNRWPRQETLSLLEIRSRLDSKFRENNQKAPLWNEFSRKNAPLIRFLYTGAVELAAVGVSASVFNLVSKVFKVPSLNITTSFVAEEQVLISKEEDSSQTEDNGKSQIKKLLSSISTSLALAATLGIAETVTLSLSLCKSSAGNFVNVILDPILIFLFGLGIGGAAIATVIFEYVSDVVNLVLYVHLKKNWLLSSLGHTLGFERVALVLCTL